LIGTGVGRFWLPRCRFSPFEIIAKGRFEAVIARGSFGLVSHDYSLCPETIFSSVSA
jgi:hypothetical protein